MQKKLTETALMTDFDKSALLLNFPLKNPVTSSTFFGFSKMLLVKSVPKSFKAA